jgi:hypothetical protein
LAAARRPRLILEIDIRQRVADVILDDEAGIVRLVESTVQGGGLISVFLDFMFAAGLY